MHCSPNRRSASNGNPARLRRRAGPPLGRGTAQHVLTSPSGDRKPGCYAIKVHGVAEEGDDDMDQDYEEDDEDDDGVIDDSVLGGGGRGYDDHSQAGL